MNAPKRFDVIGATHPEPPYPGDVRAKGWQFQLDVERIENSDTWTLTPQDMRPWLLMLWMRAWTQTPCGSLPAADELIAGRIGMDQRVFAVHRDTLMRGWYRCSDGRLYHAVLTELVEAMRDSRKADRLKKQKQREKNQVLSENVPGDSTGTPQGVTGVSQGCPPTGPGSGSGSGEENIAPSVLFPTTPVGDGSAPTPKAKRTRKPKADEAPSVSTLVWDAYSTAYRAKYRIDPVRNAAVNGQIANFVSRIPSEEAPDVATFYLGHKNPLYLNAAHAVNLLVRDAEKLRMEWATGQQIMPAEKLTFRQRDIADKTARVAEIGGARIAAKNAATYSADPFTLENEPHDAPRLD